MSCSSKQVLNPVTMLNSYLDEWQLLYQEWSKRIKMINRMVSWSFFIGFQFTNCQLNCRFFCSHRSGPQRHATRNKCRWILQLLRKPNLTAGFVYWIGIIINIPIFYTYEKKYGENFDDCHWSSWPYSNKINSNNFLLVTIPKWLYKHN